MSVQLEVKATVANLILRQLEKLALPPSFFLSCKQAAEFELADSPGTHLKFAVDGHESFHEYRSTETWLGRSFKLTWEIEWDRAANRFHVLDWHILEVVSK